MIFLTAFALGLLVMNIFMIVQYRADQHMWEMLYRHQAGEITKMRKVIKAIGGLNDD